MGTKGRETWLQMSTLFGMEPQVSFLTSLILSLFVCKMVILYIFQRIVMQITGSSLCQVLKNIPGTYQELGLLFFCQPRYFSLPAFYPEISQILEQPHVFKIKEVIIKKKHIAIVLPIRKNAVSCCHAHTLEKLTVSAKTRVYFLVPLQIMV